MIVNTCQDHAPIATEDVMSRPSRPCALVEVRGLPAQAVAAVEVAEQLEARGYDIQFVASKVPEWFVTVFPALATKVLVLPDKRVHARYIPRGLIESIRAVARLRSRRRNQVTEMYGLQLFGVQVGDLILDSAIRRGGAWTTRTRRWFFIAMFTLIAAQLLAQIHQIATARHVAVIVTSSRSYASTHGILSRYGHDTGLRVINVAPTFVAYTYREQGADRLRTQPHQDVLSFVERARKDVNVQARISAFVGRRFSAESHNLDYKHAIRAAPKTDVGLEMNKGALPTMQRSERAIYLAPHVFADAVHMEGPQLFRDYVDWFIETIRQVQHLPNATWWTKTHPAARDYGEGDLVRRLLKRYDRRNRIVELPSETSPKAILDASDGVVTVRGTVAMEFGIHGKPALIAGNARYSHLGFTISPTTREDYSAALADLAFGRSVEVDSFAAAATLFYLESHLIDAQMPDSAFSVNAVDLAGESWGTIAARLAAVREQRTDPFLAKIAQVLDSEDAIYE